MIFNYSKMISQVASLPVKILNTKTLKSSPEQTLAKYYLIAQIERIRKKPEMNKILYRKLFEITGDDAALNIKQRRATRIKMIKAILNDFTRQGYILNWTETVCGKTKDGV